MSKRKKAYTRMDAAELAEATAEFEEPLPPDAIVEESTAGAPVRQAPKRVRGRPRIGKGAANVLISLEREFLLKVDQFAQANDHRRSELIRLALEVYLQAHELAEALASLQQVHKSAPLLRHADSTATRTAKQALKLESLILGLVAQGAGQHTPGTALFAPFSLSGTREGAKGIRVPTASVEAPAGPR